MEYLDIFDENGNYIGKEQEKMYIKMHYGIKQFIVGYTIKKVIFIFK